MNTKQQFLKTIDKYNMLKGVDTVIVGVSGGADSVCLLLLLNELKGDTGFALEAVHVHHGIRKEADRDLELVKSLCERLNVKLHIYKEDIPALAKELKLSEEEAGRIKRYEAFNSALNKRKGVIAVAHNASDSAETLLFNLMRGASLNGLTGIKPVNGNIIRPLLYVERSDIEAYLESIGAEYVTDETNLSDDYTRNKIRHNILDYAKENITPNVIGNINRAAAHIAEADRFLESETKAACNTARINENEFDVDKLLLSDKYIAKRIIYNAVCALAGRKKDIMDRHIDAIYGLLLSDGSGEADLPYNIRAIKEYNVLSLKKKVDNVENVDKSTGKSFTQRIITKFDLSKIPNGLYTKWFDYDKICDTALIRTRREGDYLLVDKDMHKKTLKDFFINEKVPKSGRDTIPLVADGSHIMWIVGYRISEYYKVSKETKNVLEISFNTEALDG